jgi:hypothetical protein
MFQSYIFKDSLISKDGRHYCWAYEITDSKFGTVSGVATGSAVWPYTIGAAVIIEYGKRNLNVAANLAICFVWISKQYIYWPIQQIIDNNKKYNSLFPPYEEDLQKYLALL